ncbi:LTA synthase family protein [Aromatoleum diolicum]|uniref:Sulfatase-like hydrolase/transferase n=1 Tax=Aromatoleum diolicum TaxID=75796 RepID=A0ABX1QHX5_9RHOO|nr:alkaline phosphatase family protein [Aromatoleum diolicum]NMG77195.1 sulfatase-like hydrolase/transferase [Aromatoleum diolicum]
MPLTEWTQSRRLRFLVGGTALFFIVFALLRLVFLIGFADYEAMGDTGNDRIVEAVGIGLRFDLRLAILVMLPVVLFAFVPRVNLLTSRFMRGLSRVYLGLVIFAVLLVYVIDFGHYDYLGLRINSTVLRFLGNADISAGMLWQSYPVLQITLGWLAASVLVLWAILKLERRALDRPPRIRPRVASALLAVVAIGVLTLLGLIGRVTSINPSNPVPLRWSDAFVSGNSAVGALGLNPVIFIYDTVRTPQETFDRAQVAKHYPLMTRYLGVTAPDADKLPLVRQVGPQPHRLQFTRTPNVVFVMLESLGASRLGTFGNPLNPTPNLDALAREGWLFRNFHVPVSGTAKTVWASITGIPDAARAESATRNPFISNQHTIINALQDHRKVYAVGGSAGWANMNALIQSSIDGLELYQEGSWKSPNGDVWGISDLNLFRETSALLKEDATKRPFFAYIQTAGNHRPYTIPTDNEGFEIRKVPAKDAQDAGFQDVDQFNAVRLLDHNIGRFMEIARKDGYFDNTIFVLFGDHNGRISHLPFMPPAFEQLNLESTHVPAIIYAPKLLKPRVFEEAASLVDLLPTVAGLLGVDYHNGALGRDVQIPAAEGERAVHVILREGAFPLIGAVTRNFLVQMNHDGSQATMHDLASATPTDNVAASHPDEFARLSELARGLHETSRFMMYENRRAPK